MWYQTRGKVTDGRLWIVGTTYDVLGARIGLVRLNADRTLAASATADGLRDPDDLTLEGITVFLDANTNGVLDGNEARTVSDAQGRYAFRDLATAGVHTIGILRPGFAATVAGDSRNVRLGSIYCTGVDIGVRALLSLSGDRTVDENQLVTLTATAIANANYEWRLNGSVLQSGPTESFTVLVMDPGVSIVEVRVTVPGLPMLFDSVRLLVNNLAPTVTLTSPISGPIMETVGFIPFIANAVDPGDFGTTPPTFRWYVDNVLQAGVTDSVLFVSSRNQRTFNVRVEAIDGQLVASSNTLSATILNVAPVVLSVNGPASPREEENLTYTAVVSDPGPDDAIAVAWSWRRGTTGIWLPLAMPFRPLDLGFFSGDVLQLRTVATDDVGATGESVRTLTVLNSLPRNVAIQSPPSVSEGLPATFTANHRDPNSPTPTGEVFSYAWTVTPVGGSIPIASGNLPTFEFTPADNGAYQIVLTVRNSLDVAVVVAQSLTVLNVLPTVSLTQTPTGGILEGQTVTYTASSYDVAGDTVSYRWIVDGVVQPGITGPTFDFTPPDDGTYSVVVEARDEDMPLFEFAYGSVFLLTVSNVAPTLVSVTRVDAVGMPVAANTLLTEGGTLYYLVESQEPPNAADTVNIHWRAFGRDGRELRAGVEPAARVPGTNRFIATVSVVAKDDGVLPAEFTAVDDDTGMSLPLSTSTTATNTAPTATSLMIRQSVSGIETVIPAGGRVDLNLPMQITLNGATDAGAADVEAGLRYSFDLDGDGTDESFDTDGDGLSDSTLVQTASVTTAYLRAGNTTIRVRVHDKDGGVSADYLQLVRVGRNVVEFVMPEYSVHESAGQLLVRARRIGSLTQPASVPMTIAPLLGATTPGVVFILTTSVFEFLPGQAEAEIMIAIVNDSLPESNERFNLTLPDSADGTTSGEVSTTVVTISEAVSSFQINDGGVQRSRVSQLQLTFNAVVSVNAANFQLNRNAISFPGLIGVNSLDVNGKTVATLTFSGAGTEFDSLTDGRYTLTITGVPNFNDPLSFEFHRLFGDVNGDGSVDGSNDFAQFGNVFGVTLAGSPFDFNNDGTIDGPNDFAQFGGRFGTTI